MFHTNLSSRAKLVSLASWIPRPPNHLGVVTISPYIYHHCTLSNLVGNLTPAKNTQNSRINTHMVGFGSELTNMIEYECKYEHSNAQPSLGCVCFIFKKIDLC